MTPEGRGNLDTEGRLVAAAVKLFSKAGRDRVGGRDLPRRRAFQRGVLPLLQRQGGAVQGHPGAHPGPGRGRPWSGWRGRRRASGRATTPKRCSGSPAEHPDLVSVFREGQDRYYEYERRLVGIYLRTLSAVLGQEIGLAEYLFALGGLRFCAITGALNAIPGAIGYGLRHPQRRALPRPRLRSGQGLRRRRHAPAGGPGGGRRASGCSAAGAACSGRRASSRPTSTK